MAAAVAREFLIRSTSNVTISSHIELIGGNFLMAKLLKFKIRIINGNNFSRAINFEVSTATNAA